MIRKHKRARILQYGTGLSIAIIGFIIWPDLTRTQLLNYAIKTRPIRYYTILITAVKQVLCT